MYEYTIKQQIDVPPFVVIVIGGIIQSEIAIASTNTHNYHHHNLPTYRQDTQLLTANIPEQLIYYYILFDYFIL